MAEKTTNAGMPGSLFKPLSDLQKYMKRNFLPSATARECPTCGMHRSVNENEGQGECYDCFYENVRMGGDFDSKGMLTGTGKD